MLLKCPICQDHHSSALFAFLLCGHGFCTASLENYKRIATPVRGKMPCPICREPFRPGDLHPIFIDSEVYPGSQPPAAPHEDGAHTPDAHFQDVRYSRYVLKQAACTGDRIRRMTVNVDAHSVEKAAKDIQEVLAGLDGELCSLETLLSAVADFWLRVVPVFATVAAREKEIAALNNSIASLRRELEAAEVHAKRKADDAMVAEQLARSAVDTADQARIECARARDDAQTLRHRMDAQLRDHRTQMDERADELAKLRGTLVAHKKKESKQKDTIVELRQRLEEKEATIHTLRQSAAQSSSASTLGAARRHNAVASSSQLSVRSSMGSDVYPHGAEETVLDSDSESGLDYMDAVPPRSSSPARARFVPSQRPAPARDMLPLQRPKFSTDWNLPGPQSKRKRPAPAASQGFPIALDGQGHAQGTVQLGSRQRLKLG